MSVAIPLTRGQSALVDDSDFHIVANQKWYALWSEEAQTFYAARSGGRANGKRILILMHRLITGTTERTIHVDHKNHIGTDNQRSNLRVCTPSLNGGNRRSRIGKSKFKGVSWDSKRKKWLAELKTKGKRLFLGRHDSEEAAALAYNRSASEVFGEFAFLNSIPCEVNDVSGSESSGSGPDNSTRQPQMAG